MLVSKFKTKQREDFEAMGWKFIQFSNEAGRGFPDTLCLAPNGYHCFVEWKQAKTSKKQPLQQYWHKKLNIMGHDSWFVYPQNVNEWRAEALRKGAQ
jgi:hypothetical protein